jgi:hypothetical protein
VKTLVLQQPGLFAWTEVSIPTPAAGEALVRVLHELVHRQSRVVRLHHRVRHLGRGDDRVGGHDAVRVLLADLGDEQGAHARARAAAQRVRDLEALQAVARLRLLADDVQHRVD